MAAIQPESARESLFAAAIVEGTDQAIAAWIADGPGGVYRLRQELTRERRIHLPEGTSDRFILDNLRLASCEAARAFPDEFLTAFADTRWDEDPFACAGFGAIRRPKVTERLLRTLQSKDHWLRIDAAVALRGHQHPDLKAALEAALEDPDYLMRYHVEERLAEIAAQSQPRDSER